MKHTGHPCPCSEEALLQLIQRQLPPPALDVVKGIGDDCAVIRSTAKTGILHLLKTDALVEEIHYRRGTSMELVGWKALCRPVSDIAAMGGTPLHAVITVAAPATWKNSEWISLYRGFGKAARAYGISVVGGETVKSPGAVFISVALTGKVKKKNLRLRSGARPGDMICVTGKLGGSFKSGRHLRFKPRLHEAQWMAEQRGVTSIMDLSDGLGSDLPKLALASACSFKINQESLPLHRGCSIRDAISNGEDYELLVTVAPQLFPSLQSQWSRTFRGLRLTSIGVMLPSTTPSALLPLGHDHLASVKRTG